jgi:histidyl-tRNA synthetase
MASNVSIPKGTRDFSPTEMIRRKYIFNTVEDVFRLYGYQPIETPAMENLSTLLGKYGEEGDKLIFRVLNSGDFLKNVPIKDFTDEIITELGLKEVNKVFDIPYSEDVLRKKIRDYIKKEYLSEKALRYDLTVPFARYIVQHLNDITFPFKRYQIQPVWRADKPQKGRYREFYQCDVDVIGSNSLLNEVELIQIIDKVFQKLGLKITIKINNRKILSGIAEVIGANDKIVEIAVALDKEEKIGWENVLIELRNKGLSDNSIKLLGDIFNYGEKSGKSIVNNAHPAPDFLILDNLIDTLKSSKIGTLGIYEIKKVISLLKDINPEIGYDRIKFDPSLARGLNYYTGAIFEVKANDVAIGSICGGGRYDNLTGIFGLSNVSGVGISFGADRIYDVMKELNLFTEDTKNSIKVLFFNYGPKDDEKSLNALIKFRDANIASELYPDADNEKKQFLYAEKKKIPFVVLKGNNLNFGQSFILKNIITGEKMDISLDDMINKIKN